MALDIKELAKNLKKQSISMSVEHIEVVLQDVFEEGKTFFYTDFARHSGANKEDVDNIEKIRSRKTSNLDNQHSPQPHYDNSKGSLYKIAKDRKWNAYQFDIVKRIDRAEKKGQFDSDLNKTIDVIKIWLDESK